MTGMPNMAGTSSVSAAVVPGAAGTADTADVAGATRATDATAKLLIRNICKSFEVKGRQPLEVLQNITIDVEKNEFAVVVGPSGCGKSTLLNIIAGLEDASAGAVLMDGNRPITGPGADRGMVFQNYSLFPWLTVRKNIEFGPRVNGIPAAERQALAEHYIDVVGLRGFEDALPRALSGGMKQRVAIARTMANKPEVLLMDEPFGALDAQTRVVMQELLVDVWQREKTTVVFITHDIDEAIILGTRIYVMSRRPGRIQAILPVCLPGSRNHSLLATPEFLNLKKQIMDMLWAESLEAASE